MGKLIDSDWLRAQWDEPTDWKDGDQVLHHYTWYKTMIDVAPEVDAEPVRYGRWIREDYWSQGVGMGESYGYYYKCSECGNLVRGGYDGCGKKYCDECGAKNGW